MIILSIQLTLLVVQIVLGIISFVTDEEIFLYISYVCCAIILFLALFNLMIVFS